MESNRGRRLVQTSDVQVHKHTRTHVLTEHVYIPHCAERTVKDIHLLEHSKTVRYHSISTGTTIIKGLGKDVKLEPTYAASGNVKQCNHFKSHWLFAKILTPEIL